MKWNCQGGSLVAQQARDSVLLLLWHGFCPWPRNLHIPGMQPKRERGKKKVCKHSCDVTQLVLSTKRYGGWIWVRVTLQAEKLGRRLLQCYRWGIRLEPRHRLERGFREFIPSLIHSLLPGSLVHARHHSVCWGHNGKQDKLSIHHWGAEILKLNDINTGGKAEVEDDFEVSNWNECWCHRDGKFRNKGKS